MAEDLLTRITEWDEVATKGKLELQREVIRLRRELREHSKFKNGDGKPVVALDIDGSLGDYHKHFLWFAEKYFGRAMPGPKAINPGLHLSQYMGVSDREYQDCKLAYRQGGMKRWMPCYAGAAELTAAIQQAGAEVWLCTTRPYLRLDNIDPDTREWLRRNDIQYDAIIFGDEDKYKELIRQVGFGRIVAVFDDLPERCFDALELGIKKVYFKTQPYNVGLQASFPAVHELSWLQEWVLADIKEWKSESANV